MNGLQTVETVVGVKGVIWADSRKGITFTAWSFRYLTNNRRQRIMKQARDRDSCARDQHQQSSIFPALGRGGSFPCYSGFRRSLIP